MKKITDERLILRNLQNTRVALVVLMIGVLSILGYDLFQGGPEKMLKNPLWVVWTITTIVYFYLTMSVSVEHERKINNPKKSFVVSLIIIIAASAIVGFLVSITPDFYWTNGLLLGAIVFICGFIPSYYVYRLRVKQVLEFGDE